MQDTDACPCMGPSCGRAHRGDDPCHCPELTDSATWHRVIVPAAERTCIHGEQYANAAECPRCVNDSEGSPDDDE